MKRSIRTRLFFGISAIVLFFVIFSWVMNNQFLDRFYLEKKKSILTNVSQKTNQIYEGEPEKIALELEMAENNYGINISIIGQDGTIKYSTFSRILNQFPFDRKAQRPRTTETINSFEAAKQPRSFIFPPLNSDNNGFFYQKDSELNINYLMKETTLSNGDILLLRTPLAAISENAAIANDFLMITGILSLLLGSIWAYLFSKKFTKPILKLNKIAQNMAGLDFTETYEITTKDEIGDLGESINFLSKELESAIVELQAKNRQLEEDIEKERKIDQMRKEFVSNVSHELKTPLSLIQGYAEGLKLNVIDDERNKQFYCEVIIDEAAKMDTLVKDLLHLSQIDSGYYKLDKTDFDLSSLIDYIASKFQVIFADKDIVSIIDKPESLFVCGDIMRVEQVLVNYITNALQHVDENKTIKLGAQIKLDKVRVSVFNTGKNIPEEETEQIWTSFYKIDKARTRDYGGYGLGLSIVRAILEQHQNEYGVINMENGVEFWFELAICESIPNKQ